LKQSRHNTIQFPASPQKREGKSVLSNEPSTPGEKLEKIYRRHRQGAWVRSGASLFMWIFALPPYLAGMDDVYTFAGISLSVIYLILINPPTLWLMKRLQQKKHLEILALFIHALEVLGYTSIIYFAGGLSRSFLTLLYPALIAYVGIMAPGYWSFIMAGYCSLSFTGMITLEYFQVIPHTQMSSLVPWPLSRQMLDAGIISGCLLVTAFIVSFTSNLIRSGKENLREKNQALEEAMEKALASDRMKSEFLANMSHELRTPLNHIIGFSELLADRHFGKLNTTQEEYLGDILQSSRHLLSLINDVLDLAKVEAGKMELECSEIPLQSILEGSLAMIKEKALKHRLQLSTAFRDIPPFFRADERKLKQILYNLLSNAVKFTPEGGTVHVEARGLNGQGVEITVHDSGIGLKEEDLERIFQPFEQGDNSTSRKYQGTGLGLTLTKRMVELHAGRIWVDSEGLGEGSAFHFTLPLIEAGPEGKAVGMGTEIAEGSKW
jgi:signal transduction histidine kinase